jgi:hypothetical protein
LTVIAPRVKETGYLRRDDFLAICRWKSPRPTRYYEYNREDFIEATTRIAFSTSNEQLRVQVLTLLRGVKLRVASAILHVAHKDRYPILVRRALWSLHVPFAGPGPKCPEWFVSGAIGRWISLNVRYASDTDKPGQSSSV